MRLSAFVERLRRDRRGASVIEFGIIGALLVLLIVAGMDLARFWFTAEALRSFTAEVARSAQICDSSVARTALLAGSGNCSSASLRTRALQRVTGLDPTRVSVTVTAALVPNQPDRINITVSVTYDFDFVVGALGKLITLSDSTSIEV